MNFHKTVAIEHGQASSNLSPMALVRDEARQRDAGSHPVPGVLAGGGDVWVAELARACVGGSPCGKATQDRGLGTRLAFFEASRLRREASGRSLWSSRLERARKGQAAASGTTRKHALPRPRLEANMRRGHGRTRLRRAGGIRASSDPGGDIGPSTGFGRASLRARVELRLLGEGLFRPEPRGLGRSAHRARRTRALPSPPAACASDIA